MEKICRHETLVQIPKTRMKECKDCGVWKGDREDPHAYIKEYYTSEALQIFKHKIIRRNWYFHIHKSVLDSLGVPFLNFKRYLEIGCSVGRLLWTLHRDHDKDCVGVESSDWAHRWIEETLGFDKTFNVYKANFEYLDKSLLGKFDFIYSCHVIEHFDNPMKALEECYDMLNEGGYLYFVVPDQEHQKRLHVHNWAYSSDSLKMWFKQLGLVDIKVGFTKPYNGDNVEELSGHYLHAVGRKVKK